MVLIMVPVMVRFWSVLPERRPVHLLEEPENGAELGGGAIRAFSELVGVRRGRLAELLYIAPHRPSKAASGCPAGLQSRKPYPHSRILTPI